MVYQEENPRPLGRIAVTITAGPPGHLPHEPSRDDDPGTEPPVGDSGVSKSDSTLAFSGGVAGSVHQEAEEVGWRIGQQRGAGRGWRILVMCGAAPAGPRRERAATRRRERLT